MDDLLPPNATPPERALSLATARASDLAARNRPMWDPAACPAALLPWLAWALSVDVWNPSWPDTVKRRVIAASADYHRRKGTLGAVRSALEAIDLDFIRIVEWWEAEGSGDPFTFRVEVGTVSRGLSQDEQDRALAIVMATKNVRSRLEDLRIYLQQASRVPVHGAATLSGEAGTVYPWVITDLDAMGAPCLGAGLYGAEVGTVYPFGA